MEYITTKEIASIITNINKNTLHTYLCGYRFSKFRLTDNSGINAKYILNRDFINTLYNFLWYKNKCKSAIILKQHFKDFRLEVMKFEEYVK